ncbi:MAG: XdhC/CoxI family protein [Spartobacteria bacterium]|nr:XdhC/CoxI family protein [Spartobacteria bacterium]
MSNAEIAEFLAESALIQMPCAMAMLVNVQHSSPRPLGSCYALRSDGETAGAVSMGCVEADIRLHLQEILDQGKGAVVLHYGSDFDPLLDVGLTCGGEIDVLCTWYNPCHEAWKAWQNDPHSTTALFIHGIAGAVMDEHVYISNGQMTGSLSDDTLIQQIMEKKNSFLTSGKPRQLCGEKDNKILVDVLPPTTDLLIVGASPIAEMLCRTAVQCAMQVTLLDPRKSLAKSSHYPDATAIIHAWPEEGMAERKVHQQTLVCILAHDEKLDIPALRYSLNAHCRYIGMLGSSRTQTSRKNILKNEGFSDEALARIHGPIGLAIHAVSSAEIAVSIMAELIAVLHN